MWYDWMLQSAYIILNVLSNIKYLSGSSEQGKGGKC